MSTTRRIIATCLFLTAASAPVQAADVLEAVRGNPDYSTFIQAIDAAGLSDELASADEVTLFAPTNEAFAQVPGTTIEHLKQPENREELRKILRRHYTFGVFPPDQLVGAVTPIPTADLNRIPANGVNGEITVGGADVVASNVMSDNTVVYGIDSLIAQTPVVQ